MDYLETMFILEERWIFILSNLSRVQSHLVKIFVGLLRHCCFKILKLMSESNWRGSVLSINNDLERKLKAN